MKIIFVFFLICFGFLFVSCGSEQQSKITIDNSWVRNSSEGKNTAFYFDLVNEGSADTLFKVESDLAELVEIHETFEKDDMMGMREVENIPVDANSTFNFKPGAHHIMLINLKRDLSAGEVVEFVLHFRNSGKISAAAEVRQM
jgi:periplasmic copper chaperone A